MRGRKEDFDLNSRRRDQKNDHNSRDDDEDEDDDDLDLDKIMMSDENEEDEEIVSSLFFLSFSLPLFLSFFRSKTCDQRSDRQILHQNRDQKEEENIDFDSNNNNIQIKNIKRDAKNCFSSSL